MRIAWRFCKLRGLGLIATPYLWALLGFVAALSCLAYSSVAEVRNRLLGTLFAMPNLFTTFSVGGGGVGGHLLLGLGRWLRVGPQCTPSPAEPKGFEDVVGKNAVVAFFYYEIWTHLIEAMHVEAERFAHDVDWATIKDVCCRLLGDEISAGRLNPATGKGLVKKIRTFRVSGEAAEDVEYKYEAIRDTISNSSYKQLKLRLVQKGFK